MFQLLTRLGLGVGIVLFATAATYATLKQPIVLLGFALVVGFIVAAQRADRASALLLCAAMFFARPNILGEVYSPVALGLAIVAVLFTLVVGGKDEVEAPPRQLLLTPLFVFLSLLWSILLTTAMASAKDVRPVIQGAVLTAGFLLLAAIVLAEPVRRRLVAKIFTVVVIALCASYVITVVVWLGAGVGSGKVFSVLVGNNQGQPVYFPFTPSISTQAYLGYNFPRFTGIGREPGWMAMYIGFTYFLLPRIGWSKWWIKPILLVGLIGCISTAGFGVFVVAWAFERFLRRRPGQDQVTAVFRVAVGFSVMAGAVWVALYAPALGFFDKVDLNEVSYNDRLTATQAGLSALINGEWFTRSAESGINLIASIAAQGLPYVLLVLAALLVPRVGHPAKHLTTTPVLIVVLTLLFAQPSGDSTWAFFLVMLAYALPLGDGPAKPEPVVPTQRALLRTLP